MLEIIKKTPFQLGTPGIKYTYIDDFTRMFYVNIGSLILTLMLVNVFKPIIWCITDILMGFWKKRKYRTQDKVNKSEKNQYELNKIYKNTHFNLEYGYA